MESLLARNYHQKNLGNLNFYFNPARGLFEPIAYDMFSADLTDTYEAYHNRLLNRIMRHEPFRKQFEKMARAYVENPQNLADDLAFYDETTKQIEKDIMADTAKLVPTRDFFSYYRAHRQTIIDNVAKIRRWLADGGSLPITFAEETYPLPSDAPPTYDFSSFKKINWSTKEFVNAYPQFRMVDENLITLGPGAFAFYKDIIIPRNARLVINPDTTIYLDKRVSFISYGTMESNGLLDRPVIFKAADAWIPWGAFGTLGTSTFTYTSISGGSDAIVNGIHFYASTQ